MNSQVIKNFSVLKSQRQLIRFLGQSRRESSLRQTALGKLWLLLEPLGSMLVYYVMLTVIFHAGPRYGVNPFIFIMCGIAHFFLIRTAIANGCPSIGTQGNLMLQTRIEPLVFYAVAFRETVIDFLTFLGLFGCFLLYLGPPLNIKILTVYPLCLALLLMLAWSWGLFSAVVTVYFRDFQRISGFFSRFVLYCSPVLYSISFVPERMRDIYMLNPVATIFTMIQAAIFNHEMPSDFHIGVACGTTIFCFLASHMLYNKLKYKFTKVL